MREEKTVKSGRCARVTGATAMPPKMARAVSSESDGAADDQDHLALRLI